MGLFFASEISAWGKLVFQREWGGGGVRMIEVGGVGLEETALILANRNPTLPSSENAQQSVPWKPVESEDLEFLEVAQGGRLLKGAGLLGNRAHFWSALPLSARNIRNMQSSIPQPRKRDEF